MNWHPLARLLTGADQDRRPVALRGTEELTIARLRADVRRATPRLAGRRRAVLACTDAYCFAVGLLALLHAGTEAILPANTQPGTLAALAGETDLVVDDAWLARPGDDAAALAPIDAERPGITLFTSGSTGTPKRLRKSPRMLDAEAATLHATWPDAGACDAVQSMVSHQHMFGLAFRLIWPLAAGIPIAAATHAVWETVLPTLTDRTMLVASPAQLSRLGGLPPLPAARRPALIFTAGAPLSPASAAETQAILGRAPVEIFGSSETGAVATRVQVRGDEPWRLLPGQEMRTDAEGRLALRSCYMPDWQDTADVIETVPGGFRFLGRADDVVKIAGQRVSLAQVERALCALPEVAEAAVLRAPAAPDRLAAVVVPTDAGWDKLAGIGAFRLSRLLRHALSDGLVPAVVPRQWRFVDTLPARALGKRDMTALAALFGEPPPFPR